MTPTDRPQNPRGCRYHSIRLCAEYKVFGCKLIVDGYCPDYKPKEKKDENDCINRRADCCWLTAHHHDRKLIVYPCAYLQHNCKECKDYKPKEKKDNESKRHP